MIECKSCCFGGLLRELVAYSYQIGFSPWEIKVTLWVTFFSQPDSTEEWAAFRISERSMHLIPACCLNRGSVFLGPHWDCKAEDSTTSLGTLLRCSVTFTAKSVFQTHTASSVFQFGPTLVLWLGTSEKTWSCFLLPLHFKYTFTTIIPSGVYIKNGFMPLHTVVAHLHNLSWMVNKWYCSRTAVPSWIRIYICSLEASK